MRNRLFDQERSEPYFVETLEANDLSQLTDEEICLGRNLAEAFHGKENPDRLLGLVQQGAPVNFRLDYGLEIKREADFVAQFYLLLGGDEGREILLANARELLGDEKHARGLVDYVSTALKFYDILYSASANNKVVPLDQKFRLMLLTYAVNCRANPDHENGSLIIAAGIREVELVSEILSLGSPDIANQQTNGANVNFRGYFGDNAAVWSAILLDYPTLEMLIKNESDISNIGVSGSSLLHWVAVADRLPNANKENVSKIARLLLDNGANPLYQNKLGKSVMDYARGELKSLFEAHIANRQRLIL